MSDHTNIPGPCSACGTKQPDFKDLFHKIEGDEEFKFYDYDRKFLWQAILDDQVSSIQWTYMPREELRAIARGNVMIVKAVFLSGANFEFHSQEQ